MKKTAIWISGIIVIFGIFFVHFYIPRFIVEIKNPIIALAKKEYVMTNLPSFNQDGCKGQYIQFKSFDNTTLNAYITYSAIDTTKGTILLLHGIRAKKEHFIKLSRKLAAKGFNSVALDSRAHGSSEGVYCTFGVKEKQDIVVLLDQLETSHNSFGTIGIWGQSLGGAIAIQAMGVDKRIEFGIIESTFTDFRTITNDYFNFHLGFNIPLLTNYLVDRAGVLADFNPDEAKPIEFVKKINQPILFVHGNQDDRIKIEYGKELYDTFSSKNKMFLEIEGANHLNVWQVGGEAYFDKVINFAKLSSQ